MYLRLSDGNLINLDLVTDVKFNEINKTATLYGYQLVMVSDSKEAFKYFTSDAFKKQIING